VLGPFSVGAGQVRQSGLEVLVEQPDWRQVDGLRVGWNGELVEMAGRFMTAEEKRAARQRQAAPR